MMKAADKMNNDHYLILNVDDNDGARYVKTRILQGAGFRVAEAANGTDALALARQLLPALVLLDVKLPDINGIEVCRRIKADSATSMVLVLQTSAALTGRDDKIRGLEGGADNYLAAPIEADELIANVNALLRLQRAQTELRNSEERFRQLTDNIDDVFWMFTLDPTAPTTLLYVSAAYAGMWGRSQAGLEAWPDDWMAAIHADDRMEVVRRWHALQHGASYEQEFRLTLGGDQRWVRDRAFFVRDAADTPYRIARITSDITGRKQMEALLHTADENKNNFLATLAHELRNPLSPIRNAVTLMEEAGEHQPALQQKARNIIARQVNHLTRLVDDLLDVARISEGKLTLQSQQVELHAVLSVALETAAPIMQARGHTLQVDVPPQPIWLHGDPVRLAQAVGNLLHNAAKFTNMNGAVRLQVDMPDGHRVRIAVRDNGVGITDYNLPRIFGMFTQGYAAEDRAHDGLGIGLSLVATLVQMHGGHVSAASSGINRGSTFTIELPVVQAIAPAAPTPAPVSVAPARVIEVLLVDDNVDSIDVLVELLGALGYRVHAAYDANSALALARLHQPDAIMLDIGMPNVDGYTLARMLRADPQFASTRLVAHTGYGSPLDRERTAAAGFDFHLVKPADLAELERALRPA